MVLLQLLNSGILGLVKACAVVGGRLFVCGCSEDSYYNVPPHLVYTTLEYSVPEFTHTVFYTLSF